jgi:hypothetical protein
VKKWDSNNLFEVFLSSYLCKNSKSKKNLQKTLGSAPQFVMKQVTCIDILSMNDEKPQKKTPKKRSEWKNKHNFHQNNDNHFRQQLTGWATKKNPPQQYRKRVHINITNPINILSLWIYPSIDVPNVQYYCLRKA